MLIKETSGICHRHNCLVFYQFCQSRNSLPKYKFNQHSTLNSCKPWRISVKTKKFNTRDAWPHLKVIVCSASFLYKQLCLTIRYFKRWTGLCCFYRPWSLLSFILQLSLSWCTAAPFSSTFIVTGDAKSTMRTLKIFGTADNKWSQHFSMPMEHFGMVSRFAGQYLVI